MIAPWLIGVLDLALPNLTTAQREDLAERIIDAMPAVEIMDAIKESVAGELAHRGVADERNDMARKIARTAAQNVIGALGAE